MALQDLYLVIQTGDGNIMQITGKVTITIFPALAINLSGVPVTGVIGTPYVGQVSATGGKAPYTFSVDVLPAGLILNSATGAISGTPTATITETSTFTVTDSE